MEEIKSNESDVKYSLTQIGYDFASNLYNNLLNSLE